MLVMFKILISAVYFRQFITSPMHELVIVCLLNRPSIPYLQTQRKNKRLTLSQ